MIDQAQEVGENSLWQVGHILTPLLGRLALHWPAWTSHFAGWGFTQSKGDICPIIPSCATETSLLGWDTS